jgi:hypothetical protein
MLRGTDKQRIENARQTKIKNNSYKKIALKAAATTKLRGSLKGSKNSSAKHFILISPDKKYLIFLAI